MPGLVSVLIPTYNRAHLISKAIDSVVAQTYSNFELIIVDDGSTDNTASVISRYLQPNCPFRDRIHYFYQENKGKSVALNNGFLKASGEWIAFLDSDDVWLPDKLELQFRALGKFLECGACFTDCEFTANDRSEPVSFPFPAGRSANDIFGKLTNSLRSLAESPCGSIITFLCRSDLFRKIGGFDAQLHFTEDYDFVFRLALLTDFCFVNLPLAIADRRSTSDERHTGPSLLWDRVDFRLQCEQYRFEKWLRLGQKLPADVRKIIISRLRSVYSSWANWHLGHRDYGKARQSIASAARCRLTLPLLAKWCLISSFPSLMKDIASKKTIFHDLRAQ